MVKKLPARFAKYFWDVEAKRINLAKNGTYVIKRMLDWSNTRGLKWLVDYYGPEKIKQVLRRSRGIRRDTAFFWMNVLGLQSKEIKCLQTPYQRTPFGG